MSAQTIVHYYTVGFISGYQFNHGGYPVNKLNAEVTDHLIAGYRAQLDGKFPKEDCRHSAFERSDFCFALMSNMTGIIHCNPILYS